MRPIKPQEATGPSEIYTSQIKLASSWWRASVEGLSVRAVKRNELGIRRLPLLSRLGPLHEGEEAVGSAGVTLGPGWKTPWQ